MTSPSPRPGWFCFCLSLLSVLWFSPVGAESTFSHSTKPVEAEESLENAWMGQSLGLGIQLPQGFSIRAEGLEQIFQFFPDSSHSIKLVEANFSRSTKLVEAECKRLGLDLNGDWAVKDFQELRQKEHCQKNIAEMPKYSSNLESLPLVLRTSCHDSLSEICELIL